MKAAARALNAQAADLHERAIGRMELAGVHRFPHQAIDLLKLAKLEQAKARRLKAVADWMEEYL